MIWTLIFKIIFKVDIINKIYVGEKWERKFSTKLAKIIIFFLLLYIFINNIDSLDIGNLFYFTNFTFFLQSKYSKNNIFKFNQNLKY
jgi:hypothetical protein